ncbi:hypothetical protein [Oceanihabitans sediminis]|uniref:hypothetical protein n=1 Tax=Oceanihabitans sediminis TaxID=1812012 RepID=UPI00299D6BA3|nr:hypothetical protein [Oceanihabitans sediminis]MDX1774349.1 hypothetical protein [Oceanihabitans sediminis]
MKYLFYIFLFIFITTCGGDKVILLPEVNHSEVTEVLDISPAYIFYDETKPDSLELNRKNLISTTNWLVNVDKRLTLEQVIPQITYLQNKKKDSNHKKEGVKNYYTCSDTSIKNLGFLEFTDVNYITDVDAYENNSPIEKDMKHITISFFDEQISIQELLNAKEIRNTTLKNSFLEEELNKIQQDNAKTKIDLMFHSELTFQDYISAKSKVSRIKSEAIAINNDEFIF